MRYRQLGNPPGLARFPHDVMEEGWCMYGIIFRHGMGSYQCRRRPQENSEYCWQHQPERIEDRRQAMIERREKAIRTARGK